MVDEKMKKTTKITVAVVSVLISILSFGFGSFALAIGPNDTIFQSYTGHSLSEDSWDMIYDVVGDKVVQDFNPGEFSENISEGLIDNRLLTDANFYVAYTNFGQVQGMYIANQNITFIGNETRYGCAPYQMMINHFHTAGDLEVFTINTFMGLLAYRENTTERNGIPNRNEEMYLGWTAYSELFKFLINEGLEQSGVPEYARFDPLIRSKGTPIQMTSETIGDNTTYRYGMSYENIFVVWQEIEIQNNLLNDTDSLNHVNIVERLSAFGMLDSLNYTYEVKGVQSESGETQVSTTTSYEIGEFNQLWIMDDSAQIAGYFGGYSYLYNGTTMRPMAFYNTSNSITDRLNGNSTTPGFSLAIANYANLFVLGVKPPERVVRDQDDREINVNEDRNLTRTDVMLRARRKLIKAFEINFEGKDTYILNGDVGSPKRAINVIVSNTKMRSPIASNLYSIASGFIERIFRTIYADFGPTERNWVLYNSESLFYLTCFPEWGGQTIVNDPVFTVFGNIGGFLGIPGMQIGLIVIVSLGTIGGLIFVIRKKRRN
jgi:hypothetical protein